VKKYPIKLKEFRYIAFYKPYGVLCQFTDTSSDQPRPTLKDYIPIPEVYSVGRLDLDSEGLLLLTNNNIIKHRLSDPQFAHGRTYWVQVERIPDEEALQRLREGVIIENYRTRKAKVKSLTLEPDFPPRDPPIRHRLNVPTCWLELTLTEGRNRQVRRMTAAVGHPTLRLVRVAINLSLHQQITLDGLKIGQWRDLTHQELSALKVDF